MRLLITTTLIIISSLFHVTLQAQWENLGAGIDASPRDYFSLHAIDENTIWALPIHPNFIANYEFTKTTDGGDTWQEGSLPNTSGNYIPLNVFAIDENTAWVIMVKVPQQDLIKIVKTTDGGASWVEQQGEFTDSGHAVATLHFFNAQEGVAFGSPGTGNTSIDSLQIFRTADGGDNWNRIPPNTLPTPLAGEGVWVASGNNSYEAKGDTLWFGSRANRVFRSTDKGVSWTAHDVGFTGGVFSIAFEDDQNGIAVSFSPPKAAKTTDGGITWNALSIPTSVSLGGIEYIPGTENTYLTNDGYQGSSKMLLTQDGGNNWETLTLPPSMDCMQFLSPTLGFGGGAVSPSNNKGLYKWTGNLADTMTHTQNTLQLNNGLVVSPNPTQEQLTINFTQRLFTGNTIIIEIFSIDGQLIQQTTHTYNPKVSITVENLCKGLYYLRISDNENTALSSFFKE